jgi:hypothetical protein
LIEKNDRIKVIHFVIRAIIAIKRCLKRDSKVLLRLQKYLRHFTAEMRNIIYCISGTKQEKYRLYNDILCKNLTKVDKDKFTAIDRDFKARDDIKVDQNEYNYYLKSILESLTAFQIDLEKKNIATSLD